MSDGGIRTRRYRRLRAAFRASGEAVDAPCWLCGQKIEYALTNDPEAWELDHLYPRSTHPELGLDPGNFRHSHQRCNRARGNRMPAGGLGSLSRDWLND